MIKGRLGVRAGRGEARVGGAVGAEIEAAETSLETWLVQQAEAGVPETVLVGVLRDYADDVERLGRVPRRWGEK